MNYYKILTALNKSSSKVLIFISVLTVLYLYKDEFAYVARYNFSEYDRVISVLDNDVLINRSLTKLMNDYQSDRAYIFIFHNGVKYYSGGHKNKMSCDYEVTNAGISSTAVDLQDIPVALYPDFILGCINNLMYHPNVGLMKRGRVKEALQAQGIKGIAVAPYYRDGKLVALIGIDFVKEFGCFNNDDSEKIKVFKEKVNGIGDLLL